MAIEAGAKVGLIAPDKTTIEYVREKSFLDDKTLQNAEDYWENLKTDKGASFDKEVVIDVSKIKPQVTWGCLLYTSPSPRDSFRSRMPSSA